MKKLVLYLVVFMIGVFVGTQKEVNKLVSSTSLEVKCFTLEYNKYIPTMITKNIDNVDKIKCYGKEALDESKKLIRELSKE
jgi:uncharacterized protein YebE (UPF0316 family)